MSIWTTPYRSDRNSIVGRRGNDGPQTFKWPMNVAQNTGAFPDLQTVARLLGGVVSGGQVLAPGPGHSAADRSLSIKIDGNAPGGFIVHSFSNDDPIVCRDYVRGKLGLPPFQTNGGGHPHLTEDFIIDGVMAAAAAQNRDDRTYGKLVTAYSYTDENGKLLYEVLRYDPKDFRQRRPDGNGGWIWKLDERRVPYRWPELHKFPDATIFITEGEKDADRLAELELCATTVAAGKWTDECIKALASRDIIILEDNDDAGRKKANEAAIALYAAAKTIRIVSLPNLPNKGDVSDWLDADPRHADRFCDVCFSVPLWSPRKPDEARSDKASNKYQSSPEIKVPFIKISAWQNQPVPERKWTVKNRIPANNVTLLSGEGSVGKSILSLQLAVATVLGKDWLGALPEPGAALVVCCEDDADEIWRRLDLIFTHYGAAYTDFDDLHILPLAGEEALMAAPDRNGIITMTKLFEHVHTAACDIRPKLIVLDNAADIFGGGENDRAQVRQFISRLRGLALAAQAGVLLTSHPSLTGISTGTGLSGSTAWDASVRSRLYFKRAKTEKDEEPDPDLRLLEVMKSNYGPVGEVVTLKWSKGVFLPVNGMSDFEKAAAEQEAERVFLVLLDQFNREGNNASSKRTAPNYAPTMFAREKEARQQKIRRPNFEAAMRRLLETDRIRSEPYGPPSRGTFRLATCK
jgi:RecA-family ATPase